MEHVAANTNKVFGTRRGSGEGAGPEGSSGLAVLPRSVYEGLDSNGSPVVMNLEMLQSVGTEPTGKGGGTEKKGTKKRVAKKVAHKR